MFPLFFGFTLVGAEKAINSFERVTFRAEGKNSSGFTSPRVLERKRVVVGFARCRDHCWESTRLLA